jgi:hypothetical protein
LGKRRLRCQTGGKAASEEALDQNDMVAFHGLLRNEVGAL